MQKVALIDDHVLLRNGLASLIESFGDYTILFQADNGVHLMQKIDPDVLPDIILMDIHMPLKDGYESSLWLKDHYPGIRILALSMYDNETSIIRMFRAGAKGYILKDCDPSELKDALKALTTRGFYYSEMITGKLIHSLNALDDPKNLLKNSLQLNERETEFLKWVCSELTYKEIANKMFVSPRTIDGYRDGLFEKLQLKTRVGLVMYAIKNNLVSL